MPRVFIDIEYQRLGDTLLLARGTRLTKQSRISYQPYLHRFLLTPSRPMISLRFRIVQLVKKVALAISRGSSAGSCSYIVELEADGTVGLGEAAEFEIPEHGEDAERIQRDLEKCQSLLARFNAWQRVAIESMLKANDIGASVRAAIDMALYDWAGKATGQPVWRLLGLEPEPRGPVSVTIGINTPAGAQERLRKWIETGRIRAVKVKLGSPSGLEADKAMLNAVREITPSDAYLGVDANGGWTLVQAIEMSAWLKSRGVVHIEQPLSTTMNDHLAVLHRETALPIFIDESCRSSQDVAKLGEFVDGINIKITKCGGLSEAMRMIATAQAMGLKTMVGCYGNTALGNGAAHQLASMIDYIDLDSHLNLSNDPCSGLEFVDGYLVNQEIPGIGVRYA
ncbi:MAG: dipeptide epimerase [Pirellula sp.]